MLLSSYEGVCLREVAKKVELHLDTVEQWVAIYKLQGLDGLQRKPWTLNDARKNEIEEKKKRINDLLHQAPSLYGINRTAWRTADLAEVYQRVHGGVMSQGTVCNILKIRDILFEKPGKC